MKYDNDALAKKYEHIKRHLNSYKVSLICLSMDDM